MSQQVIAIIIVTLLLTLALAGGTVYALRFSPRARVKRRVAAIVSPGGGSRSGGPGGDRPGASTQRKAVQAKLKELEDAQKKPGRRRTIRQMLQEAGLGISVRDFYISSAISALVVAGLYLLFGFTAWGAAPVAIAAGLWLPRKVVTFLIERRQKKFTKLFADAIDVIIRGIKSGLPVGECLNIIAHESPEPVGHEFRLFTESQRLGLEMEDALDRAVERMPTPEMKFFAIVMSIQRQTGGNLAETLGNLSRVLRDRKKMADKVKALSSEAKAT
ncbi:MAG: type II secretion system F family protein, partial [Alphaproteobacteria bacterium]|nr:type II secretion system F family protein [Alphaproteobacteria bacterium]